MERKTPLFHCHEALGGRMAPFAGYLLPIQYPAGVIAEHMAVRERAGLFDVSHMGELLFTGKAALSDLNNLLTNDFTGMEDGQVRYSPMCNEDGGCVDDLIVYRLNAEAYFVVVNAANRQKDADWMRERLSPETVMEDLSDGIAQLALQGPCSKQILSKLADASRLPSRYYRFTREMEVGGARCLVSRTGYTGEFGYELYLANSDAAGLWETLLEAGKAEGLLPCGLGARDTLRLEASMPLYGHELADDITPLEAGLDFAVKLQKQDFIGKTGMLAKLPLTRKRVGLEVTGRGIVREFQDIYIGSERIGRTTSGTHCPYLGRAAAMAYVDSGHADAGTEVEVDVRGRRIAARIVELPFYRKS